MKYLAQAYIGTFNGAVPTNTDAIVHRICNFMDSAHALIIGWNICTELYQELICNLHQQGKKIFLWLPVFSELSGSHEEDFIFVPPTLSNTAYIKDIYAKHFERLHFDGVFLDKIRYGSYADCPDVPCSLQHLRYQFFSPHTKALYKTRAKTVTASVCELIAWFHKKSLLVGLDLFAPPIAYLVGQDTQILAEYADFIKPMMYRKTSAPAGLPYEFSNLGPVGDTILSLWQIDDITSDHSFSKQLDTLKNLKCAVYPGIEINSIPQICATSKDYFNRSIELIKHKKLAGAVLSWNILETTVFDF